MTITPAECAVARHMILGMGRREIADILGISTNTVQRYQENLYIKTRVKGALSFVSAALRVPDLMLAIYELPPDD